MVVLLLRTTYIQQFHKDVYRYSDLVLVLASEIQYTVQI